MKKTNGFESKFKKALARTSIPLVVLASVVAFQAKNQIDWAGNSLRGSLDAFVMERMNANGAYENYRDDFDISGDESTPYVSSMAVYKNKTFGDVSFVCNSYGISQRVTYKSHWAESQPAIKEDYNERFYKTYKFEHYLSLPVRETSCYELQPHTSRTFTMTTVNSTTQTVSTMVESSYSLTQSVSMTIGLEIGAKIGLDLIEVSGSQSSSTKIAVSQTFSNTVRSEASRSVTFSEQASSVWTLTNDTDQYRMYSFCYRQRFILYFTTVYYMSYICTRTGVNFLGLDDSFSYTFKEYVPEKTVFFMIPADTHVPFGYDEYYYDSDGRLVLDRPFANNTLYF